MAQTAPVLLGAGAPEAPALIAGDGVVSYARLTAAADRRADELALAPRSLVILEASNTVEFVTAYLALLQADHVPLLTGTHVAALAAAWEADAIVRADDDGLRVEHCPGAPARRLHPDLALLLSTSGSTGAPKLVRLSHANLLSNARAIADYLALTPADRGITSLPLHYCYGLSVLHSHLAAGAGVVLTSASVVDPCFAAAMGDGRVTNLAGVPHSFELLERAGPELIHVPSLRFVTQAGGRMRPERVRAWAERCRQWDAAFFVMYGQTEATARIAYLPPALAVEHPQAIGRAIPGGHLDLRPVDGAPPDVGELVYRGPNVMLGYATEQSELALGATIDELATGDLARYDPTADVFEIVGRRSRFVKPFGLRIDLDAVETDLAAAGFDVVATGDDDVLVVCAPSGPVEAIKQRVVALTGLPAGAVHVEGTPVPRTANGKVDYETLRARARPARPSESGRGRCTSVADVYANVLGRSDVVASSTFLSLGGDSLSYVECSVRLEEMLGPLPADWHLRTVASLDAVDRRRGPPRLDTTALLRAVGICAVVATHMSLWYFPGGSHLMLAVVGFNFSRFHLSIDGTGDRVRAVARTIARIALPVIAFVGTYMLLAGGYGAATLGLVNNYLGPPSHRDGNWHYWFIEAMIQIMVVVTALLAVAPVRRLERRHPYVLPLLLLGGTLALRGRWEVIGGVYNLRFQTHGVAWFFVLGWLVHRSTNPALKVLTSVLCLLTLPGFFGRPEREWFIALGIIVLVWCRDVPLPRFAVRGVALVAAASMVIFISHFRIFPPLDRNLPRGLAYAATIAAGIALWFAGEHAARFARRTTARLGARRRAPAPPTTIAVALD